jgi:hypothetical protein
MRVFAIRAPGWAGSAVVKNLIGPAQRSRSLRSHAHTRDRCNCAPAKVSSTTASETECETRATPPQAKAPGTVVSFAPLVSS